MMPNTYTVAVRDLQRRLRNLAEYDPRLPPVPIDGIYDTATRSAVEAFQTYAHLPITGTVDPVTWEALLAAEQQAHAQHTRLRSISPFPMQPSDYAIRIGEESELVWLLHHMLRTIGADYDDLDDIPDGMRYTPRTAHAVRTVQGKHALPMTGQVDRPTWNVLAESYDRIGTQNR